MVLMTIIANCFVLGLEEHLPAGDKTPLAVKLVRFSPPSCSLRYDTRCYINVRSKAGISQLNLPHGTDN